MNAGDSGARMVIESTYPNLSNIVHTDFELDRVIQTVAAVDPGIQYSTFFLFKCLHSELLKSVNYFDLLNRVSLFSDQP